MKMMTVVTAWDIEYPEDGEMMIGVIIPQIEETDNPGDLEEREIDALRSVYPNIKVMDLEGRMILLEDRLFRWGSEDLPMLEAARG